MLCVRSLFVYAAPMNALPLHWDPGDPGRTDLGTSGLLELRDGWGTCMYLNHQGPLDGDTPTLGRPSPAQQQPPPPVIERKRSARRRA